MIYLIAIKNLFGRLRLMSAPIKYVDVWDTRDYDLIIDVRSPSEFREDHIPEAISLPVYMMKRVNS